LRAYEVAGTAVLDGYAAHEQCTGGRGQSLVPWPNRLRDGRYTFGGEDHQLALTEPAKQNAIHGLVRWSNFAVADKSPSSITMAHVLHPQPGYPFILHIAIRYQLTSEGLVVTTAATNVGDRVAPYGCGAHPYLRLPMPRIDAARLRAPGQTRLRADDRGIPIGLEPVDDAFDFRRTRPIGETKLDTAFTDLLRDGQGRAWVHLQDETGGRVSLWCDESYPYLMLFTGDSLETTARRRTGLGVEPMSCAPNAFQSGAGLVTLQPGESHQGTWGIITTAP
jgi:aldose 1-epimerase